MDKNPRDVIMQATQSLLESAKSAVTADIVTAVRMGQLKLENEQVQKLLLLMGSSIEEGFNRASRSFSRVVESALGTVEPQPTPSKKK